MLRKGSITARPAGDIVYDCSCITELAREEARLAGGMFKLHS